MTLQKIPTDRMDKAIQAIKNLCKQKGRNISEINYSLSKLWDSLNISTISESIAFDNTNLDRKKADARLTGFDPNNCFVWQKFCKKFGSALSQNELISIAEVISSNIGVKVDREAKRRKEVLIKWFDENSEQIIPFIDIIGVDESEEKNVS